MCRALLTTLGNDCFAFLLPRRKPVAQAILAPQGPSAPRGHRAVSNPHLRPVCERDAAPRASRRPRAALRREGRRTVGLVGMVWGDSSRSYPSCPSGQRGPRTSSPRAAPRSARTQLARPQLARSQSSPFFHWVKWPSITEAGGRACSPSVALATARPELQPGRGGQLLRGAASGGGEGWEHGECCGT